MCGAFAREGEDRVGISESAQRLGDNEQRVLFHIDDALLPDTSCQSMR